MLINAQRSYKPNSVLAAGDWYKIAVTKEGVYKIDRSFLNSLGINTNNLSSNSIHLYGNTGQMLEENNALPRMDDLTENAIQVQDGGDGIFNNTDYFIFYAPGPDSWIPDTGNAGFKHRKNIYSNQSFYYIDINSAINGQRIVGTSIANPNISITNYDARYFHELDTVNFLNSGREWYGEEFANLPGRMLSTSFPVDIPGLGIGPVKLTSSVVSRTIGTFSRFDVKANGQQVLQHNIAFTGTGNYDPFAVAAIQSTVFNQSGSSLVIQYNYLPGTPTAQGWLNWFEIQARANLNMQAVNCFSFRDWQSVAAGNIGRFTLQNATANVQVWDVSSVTQPLAMTVQMVGNDLQFTNHCDVLHEYLAFSPAAFSSPLAIGKIANQNLHNSTVKDLLIITYPSLLVEAQRLANHHIQQDNLRVEVVTTDQVYTEFSSGSQDPVALRDWVKMYFDKATSDTNKMPRYLLLLGDASFDYLNRIGNNTNLVPCWESPNSLEPLSTYTSDDFFGFLEDGDDIGNPAHLNLLDIGIGRIPARNIAEAKAIVDKIIGYSSSLGAWRNEISFIADDEDGNLHLQDAESVAATAGVQAPLFHQNKIYLDAYQQESNTGGNRYPAANNAIDNKMYAGNLIWNYNGHGNSLRLAEEVVVDADIVNGWKNENKLPLFITATCDFAPYDNPFQNTLGENILLRPKTGAIALLTTTRPVFAYSNRIINANYLQVALAVKNDGSYNSLGSSFKNAKNLTYQQSPDILNNRKFSLLGDPALTLGYPVYKVQTDSINHRAVGLLPDTLLSLGKYSIAGRALNANGQFLSSYNGTVYTTIFDKVQSINTLGNDPGSPVTSFSSQQNILYKGKAKVTNGLFSVSFIVPKDIQYNYGAGRINYYIENGDKDGNGTHTNIVIGGINPLAIDDKEGPSIRAWVNDEKFINGGVCNEMPLLIVRLKDSSGINSSGLGIGHNITAQVDNDNRQLFDLNDFYEADRDSYQSGTIHFQLPKLSPGWHSIRIKAWDVFNNSGEYVLELMVAKEEDLTISHVLNYPNPFTTKTSFWFEHNQPGENLQVHIRIFTVSGKLVKTIQETINTEGNRSFGVEWDGKDEYGEKLGRGLYIYQLVVLHRRKKAATFGKMVLF